MTLDLTPDADLGVFETMLVVDGEPVELATHLQRLRSSLDRLYGTPLPDEASALAVEAACALELGRLRLTASPATDDDRVGLGVAATAIDAAIVFPTWERGPALQTRAVGGWRGAHKWADRRLLERLESEASPAAPLLVDDDGAVLETTRANLFLVLADGRLATPPLDGRVLPGVARGRAIEMARELGVEVAEEVVSSADVASAREAFVTGSVRGVEPVQSIDGAKIGPSERPLATAVGALLRRRWLGDRAGEVAERPTS